MNLFQKIFGNKHTTDKEKLKMSNIQKALELINTFASVDTEKAKSLLSEGYIRHNPAEKDAPKPVCSELFRLVQEKEYINNHLISYN